MIFAASFFFFVCLAPHLAADKDSSCVNEESTLVLVLQELAGYTGGDTSFLKEDFELQLNKPFLWGSVSQSCKKDHWTAHHF